MPIMEKMALRKITSANYITSVNGMYHPNRVMEEHDFLYMLDGDWEIREEENTYEMHRDDLLILAAGRHHWGDKLCTPGNRHMYFHILPTPGEADWKRNMEEAESSNLFLCPTLIHCQNHPLVRQYFQELIAAYWSEDSERENRLSLLFNLLQCEIIRIHSAAKTGGQPDALVEEIAHQIRSHPQILYTAKEMAEAHFICARTLNNRFHKVYQKTFYAYQMETKLEMVRQFLTYQPDAKLHEAAVNFGFYDEFHLSKAFKKQFGKSPSQFRSSYLG